MARFVSELAVALIAVVVSACTGNPPPAPEPPPRTIEPHTRNERSRSRQRTPEHTAPPPAYGNKVVMARGPRATAVH